MVSVRSDKPLPKDRIFEVMEKINKVKCAPPVRIGDIILEKVYEDVNIIATRNIG
jgi:CxxC motif-containing protein